MPLESPAAQVSETYRITCTFDWDGLGPLRRRRDATHLYRIAAEATGTAIRHGKAPAASSRPSRCTGEPGGG